MTAPGDFLEFHPGLYFRNQMAKYPEVFDVFQSIYSASPNVSRVVEEELFSLDLFAVGREWTVYFSRNGNRIYVLAMIKAPYHLSAEKRRELVDITRRFGSRRKR